MSENLLKAAISQNTEEFAKIFRQELLAGMRMKKEATTMQVTYNGFTGELVKLERTFAPYPYVAKVAQYDLTITILKEGVCADVHFTGVRLEDVKFLGGVVTFGE